MMIIEMRQAALDKAFELLDQIKDLGREKKMALCELEETLYECFESSEEDGEEDDYMPTDDVEYRRRRSYRYGNRRSSGMRDDEEDMDMRSYRRAMRMRRRNRMGRYV